ncbi:hypothetical protein HK097_000982 [Rhizophlyctis rosea]|uniref:RIIa domain-containing protein n=1 Tax=Rhizophlyctis rosea TaxID=64517 RepID=A0AAD5X7I9_9FUNG|nr:hypothetical protein HK097_000982 [Rhizophlyctis rosea]
MATNKEKAGDPNTLPTADHRSDSAESSTTETIQAPFAEPPSLPPTTGASILDAPTANLTSLSRSHPSLLNINADGTSDIRGLGVDETGTLFAGADADKIDEGKHVTTYGLGTEVGYVGGADGQPIGGGGLAGERVVAAAGTAPQSHRVEDTAALHVAENAERNNQLDVTPVAHKASDNAIAFLASLAQTLVPALYTNSTLPLHHPSSPHPVGTRTLSIEPTTAPTRSASPAYLLNCRIRADLPFTDERIEEDLFAVIGTHMETYIQKCVKRIWKIESGSNGGLAEKTGTSEEIVEEIRMDEDGGDLYVRESGSRMPDGEWRFAGDDVKGFISQAALYILPRLLSVAPNPQPLTLTFQYYTSSTHTITHMPLTFEPHPPPRNISGFSLRTTRITAQIPSTLETAEAETQNQNEEDSILNDEGGQHADAKPQAEEYIGEFTAEEGICVHEKVFGAEFAANLDELPESIAGTQSQNDPYESRDFGGNIELISEYKERKRERTKIHQTYIENHPELYSVMADYLQLILHRKPDDVYAFTTEYFSIAENAK